MDWIALVNEAVRELGDLEPADREVLRQLLVRRLRRRFEFPLESDFEAFVKGDRRLRFPAEARAGPGTAASAADPGDPVDAADAVHQDEARAQGTPYLELVPGELSADAYEVLGGVLVGPDAEGTVDPGRDLDLRLDAGSIVEATVELDDPDRYLIRPPAMMGRLEALDVKVRVGA